MTKQYVIFSNTVEEYEPFIKANTFYWPRSNATSTRYQRENNISTYDEEIGDTIYIVVGAKIKNNIKDPFLKNKITGFPMITHKGIVREVIPYPIIGYRYSHGRNPDSTFMLPLDSFNELLQQDSYLGREFSEENKNEILEVVKLRGIIEELLVRDEIEFNRAFLEDKNMYIKNNDGSLFKLNTLSEVSVHDVDVRERSTYREMPSKKSIQKIINECKAIGLDGERLVKNLRTWRGTEFIKIEIESEIFIEVEGRLQEGVSTRLIVEDDNSDILINDIKQRINTSRNDTNAERGEGKMEISKNQILYGPPGTGKTYSVIRKAIEIIDPLLYEQLCLYEKTEPEKSFRDKWMGAYKQYTDEKQIQFCTFHQSYSYEDFIEGLRSDIEGKFVPTDGVFKEICESAKKGNQIIKSTFEFDEEQTNFYKMSLGKRGIEEDIYQYCIENSVITIGFGSEIDFSNCNSPDEIKALVEEKYVGKDKKETVTQAISYFKYYLNENDIVLISNGNSEIRAIGRVIGNYYYDKETNIQYNHFRKIEWLLTNKKIPVQEILIGRKFMMRSIYYLDKQTLNLEALENQITIVEEVKENESKNFVLIIDEINRGNISRIFGELITLIEEDKRIGEENEMVVKLPYSRKPFGVPANLYLIGTMNTADRSITLMDTALRRRFDFIEMLPDASLLPEDLEGINVRKLLETLNKRIEFLFDRDHTIGHAFFLGQNITIKKIITIIQKKVIPLLQEYFYNDWEKIEMVLGGSASDHGLDYFIKKENIQPANIFNGFQHNRLQEQVIYSIISNPTKAALLNIYESETTA